MRTILLAAGVALLLALFGTPLAIRIFTRRGYGQAIREEGPAGHATKRGTPTMGGTVIVIAAVIGYLIGNLFTGQTRNVTVGVAISLPFKNKTAEANLAGARIQKEQLAASTRSQEQLIEMDVRNSAQAVESARQRVLSAREARVNAEMQLEGEQQVRQL